MIELTYLKYEVLRTWRNRATATAREYEEFGFEIRQPRRPIGQDGEQCGQHQPHDGQLNHHAGSGDQHLPVDAQLQRDRERRMPGGSLHSIWRHLPVIGIQIDVIRDPAKRCHRMPRLGVVIDREG